MEPDLPGHSLALERPSGASDGPGARARAEARGGLYVHVPFCLTRCRYCDFSSGAISSAAVERYLSGVEREASLRAGSVAGRPWSSVFFGGGTPSALSPRHFTRLADTLERHFVIARGAEITLEANPETVKPGLLEAWAAAGVNRLSFGAQSFDARELEGLGRIHSADRPGEAIRLARGHGFRRISMDLMFGYPGHTARSWSATLDRALELEPEHLSAYCFIPEPGTPLGDAVLRGEEKLPSPEDQAGLYEMLEERLAGAGFGCYETSNFCRPDAESRHNLGYWLRRDCLALGPSAHGLIDGARYGNHYATRHWEAALERGLPPEAEREIETDRSMADEVMMLGLRLATGPGRDDYPVRVWSALERRYRAAFARALETGRLERGEGRLRIAARHRFVADDVIAWLAARADHGLPRPHTHAQRFDSPALRSVALEPCPSPRFPAA